MRFYFLEVKVRAMTNRAAAVLLFVAMTSGFAQQVDRPTIKGHALGESVVDYFDNIGVKPEYIASCRQVFKDSSTVKIQKALIKKLHVDMTACRDLVSALDGLRWTTLDKSRPHYDAPVLTFEGGKLVCIQLHMVGKPYSQILADMEEEFGEPTNSGTLRVEDGLGIEEPYRHAAWANPPHYYAAIQEQERDLMEPKTDITLMTPAEYQRILAEVRNRHHENVVK